MIKIVLLACGHLGEAILEGLITQKNQGQCEIVGVFPWSYSKPGSGFTDPYEKKLVQQLKKNKLPPIKLDSANSYAFSEFLKHTQPDVILIACWGEILKPHLLNNSNIQVINCHPSKLPAHRGANPYYSAIFMNEAETGVTFHITTPAIDDGPILYQESLPLAVTDTGGELREKCSQLAKSMVPELIHRLSHLEQYPPTPQSAEGQSYFKQISLNHGSINWQDSPEKIERQYRALKPWITPYTWLNGRVLMIFNTIELVPTHQYPTVAEAFSKARQAEQQAIPGGVIAKHLHPKSDSCSGLLITTSNPETLILAKAYQLYMGWGFLPVSISQWIAKRIAPVGSLLVSQDNPQ